jgi:hypothetical protein
MPDEEIFTEVPWTVPLQLFLDGLGTARRDLFVDPLLARPWSCNPERCRTRLGENLCCKVETRCPHLSEQRCAIHDDKPFSCALFPLDLIRVNGIRVVTTPKNSRFFDTGWSRYDRDMLQCFRGHERGTRSMFQVQREVLLRVFTRAEVTRMEQQLALSSATEGIGEAELTSPGS